MTTTKITAKMYEPLWSRFNQDMDDLFLKRDAFLNHVIRAEARHLADELGDKKLSNRAKRYISGRLKAMDKKPPLQVSIVVELMTAKVLGEVVKRHNIVRDAFLNRLVMFLRASDALLDFCDLPKKADEGRLAEFEAMPTSPIKCIRAVHDDPLFYLRTFAKDNFDCGLYLVPLPTKLDGFCCYLEEELVPGTAEFKKGLRTLDALFSTLEKLETSAFGKQPPRKDQ